MVTGDEKWVTYYNIVRKRSWSKCGEAVQTMAKPVLMDRKVLLYLVGLERNNLLGVASAWPNTKFVKVSLDLTLRTRIYRSHERTSSHFYKQLSLFGYLIQI
ncbi:hypothetical protein TNCV_2607571 [Trichonephila clavipes]|uniref:Uncharacterized protein n=1 Tax=Trichonephila clavipes TaxID=2585209 RepID=A0A8X6RYM3_TRICX|nr:hypothetical protein TNCV_2607571 [Trichonephila clavipes]